MIRPASLLPDHLTAVLHSGVPAVLDLVDAAGGTPLLDDGAATFIYVGDADAVGLTHWMDIFPPVPRFRRVPRTRLWHMTMDIPDGSRVEYQIELRRRGRSRILMDPLNPQRGGGPFGSNSVATGRGYRPSPWAVRSPAVRRGQVSELSVTSPIFAEERTYRLYVPPGPAGAALRLVVVHDGTEFLKYAALATVLDNLNAAGHSLAALLVDPGARLVEYGADPRHALHLVEEALPAARDHLGQDPAEVIGLGASFGAVAALHTAHAHPGLFSALALLSGSFVEKLGGRHHRGVAFAPVVEFMKELKAAPGPLPPRMHLSCGRFDGLIADNRRMAAWLERHRVDVRWAAAQDGHHWGLWRDQVGPALADL